MAITIEFSLSEGYPAAAVMLHLALTELDRACRPHGKRPGGPHQVAGATWEAVIADDMVEPTLSILQRTYAALSLQPGSAGARTAAREAFAIVARVARAEKPGAEPAQDA